jgi:hypothetical protein
MAADRDRADNSVGIADGRRHGPERRGREHALCIAGRCHYQAGGRPMQLAHPEPFDPRHWTMAPLYDGLISTSLTTGDPKYLASVIRRAQLAGDRAPARTTPTTMRPGALGCAFT